MKKNFCLEFFKKLINIKNSFIILKYNIVGKLLYN